MQEEAIHSSKQLLDEILKWNAPKVMVWLESVQNGSIEVPTDFNWMLLSYMARSYAKEDATLKWGRVVVRLHDYLIAISSTSEKEYYEDGLMHSRAGLLINYQAVVNEPLFEAKHIITWFFDNLTLSYEDAVVKSGVWPTLPLEEIAELRKIKNRLRPIELLVTHNKLEPEPELENWLLLRKKLP